MDRIYVCDKTLKQNGKLISLSFREKIELCRLIDRLSVDWIELPAIQHHKIDSLLIKSIASAVRQAGVAVPVHLNRESVTETWNALKEAGKARLQVVAPVSSVQMEYLYHIKPAAMIDLVAETVRECRQHTPEVEFIAEDASRGNSEFMSAVIRAAAEAGAGHITFHETAGAMLPEELSRWVRGIMEGLSLTEQVTFGIDCSNELSLADACAMEAIRSGIREIKAAAYCLDCVSLPHIVQILHLKGDQFHVSCRVRREEIRRITGQIENLCKSTGRASSSAESTWHSEEDAEVSLSVHDSKESILQAVQHLGYDLSAEDQEKVYAAFRSVAEKKETVTLRELDAMIAAEAMQVPAVCAVISYVINTGSNIGAMAHMKLKEHEQVLEGVAVGDGAIDAAFRAIEQATGRHFELDDFRIQAMTEGRDSTGETIIRLRSQGKLYSGRGISTDIVGASIMSYINALNKIIYEEEDA